MEFQLQVQKDSISNAGGFLAVLSTSRVDRQGDRILPSAFEPFKHHKKPLMVGHDLKELPIGAAAIADIDRERVLIRGQLMMTSPRAQEALSLMREGVVSISWSGKIAQNGAAYKDGAREVTRLETLDEITLCAVPANPDAQVLAVKSIGAQIANMYGGRRSDSSIGGVIHGGIFDLAKASGDPIITMATMPIQYGFRAPEWAARAPSWVSRLRRQPVSTGGIHSGRVVEVEGDVAEQTENTAKAQMHITFEGADRPLPTAAGVLHCSKQLLDDGPGFAKLADAVLSQRIIRQIERRAATDLAALDATPEANWYTALAKLADDGFVPSVVLAPAIAVFTYAASSTNTNEPPAFAGYPLLPTVGLPAGVGLAVSFDGLTFVERESLAVEIGWADDDFTKNMRRIRGETRALVDHSDAKTVRTFSLS